ncbi:MAG TPA: hypothetical protein VE177_07885 [Candidatus Binatus sp.]|nr:hypothetical protein [Candidatus Binatus sp.]
MYVPTGPLHARVELPVVLTVTLEGVREHDRPFAGEITDERPTPPENPFRLVNVICEVPTLPAKAVTLEGLAPIVKSCTV